MFKKVTLTAHEGRYSNTVSHTQVLKMLSSWVDEHGNRFPPNSVLCLIESTLSSPAHFLRTHAHMLSFYNYCFRLPDGVHVVPSFDEALSLASKLHDDAILDEAFVIGGSAMYEVALTI